MDLSKLPLDHPLRVARREYWAAAWELEKAEMIANGWTLWETPGEFFRQAMQRIFPREKMQTPKRQTRYTYCDGPMQFLGQQIVKAMEDAGYPAKIHCLWRSPKKQNAAYYDGFSKARAWQSPHQYLEAVDIIHPGLGWNVTQDYWDHLAACTRIVADRYGVELTGGLDWGWDLAHVELKDWRKVKDREKWREYRQDYEKAVKENKATPQLPHDALWERFVEVLPEVAARHVSG